MVMVPFRLVMIIASGADSSNPRRSFGIANPTGNIASHTFDTDQLALVIKDRHLDDFDMIFLAQSIMNFYLIGAEFAPLRTLLIIRRASLFLGWSVKKSA